MGEQLAAVLRNPRCTPAEAQAPIRLLLQLQSDGAFAAQPLNPVKIFLDAQVCPCLAPAPPYTLSILYLMLQVMLGAVQLHTRLS